MRATSFNREAMKSLARLFDELADSVSRSTACDPAADSPFPWVHALSGDECAGPAPPLWWKPSCKWQRKRRTRSPWSTGTRDEPMRSSLSRCTRRQQGSDRDGGNHRRLVAARVRSCGRDPCDLGVGRGLCRPRSFGATASASGNPRRQSRVDLHRPRVGHGVGRESRGASGERGRC